MQSDENEEIQEGMRKRWGERQLMGSQQGSNERRQAEEPKRKQQRAEAGRSRQATEHQHGARCSQWGAGRPQVSKPGVCGGAPTINRAQEPT